MRTEIAEHYDRAHALYLELWGEHLHHGLFDDEARGGEPLPPPLAQERLVEALAAPLGIARGERVLDLGCGVGGSSRFLHRRAGAEVVGITISAVQTAEATRRREPGGGESFAVADIESLPFASASFDVAWAVESLSHVLNRAHAMREIARVLKPGGRVAIADWFRGVEADNRERLLRRVEKGFLVPPLAPLAGYEALLAQAGLRPVASRVLTRAVAPTWDHCLARVRARHAFEIARVMGTRFIAFVRGFRAIRAALKADVMAYGMIWARKPAPVSR
jgi:SAM-dependent methyltransferase